MPVSLDLRVQGKSSGEKLWVTFKFCGDTKYEFTADSDDVFTVIKPPTGCHPNHSTLQPWLHVYYDQDAIGTEIHTSCSVALYPGQTFGTSPEIITLVGYCTSGACASILDGRNEDGCTSEPSTQPSISTMPSTEPPDTPPAPPAPPAPGPEPNCDLGDECMCGYCTICQDSMDHCHGGCNFDSTFDRPKPVSLDLKVCNHGSGELFVVHKFCNSVTTKFTADSNGVIKIEKPEGVWCGWKRTLQPWLRVFYEQNASSGYEIHTSCSKPLHLGMTYGSSDKTMLLTGYCMEDGTCNSIEGDPCLVSHPDGPTVPAPSPPSPGSPGGGRWWDKHKKWH